MKRPYEHCAGNLQKKHGLLEADHRTSRWWEESLCRAFARIALLWMTTFGGCRRETETATIERRSIATGGVQHVEGNTNGERPTGNWWCSSV